jgi:hypothetical protein
VGLWLASDEWEVIAENVTTIWYLHQFQLCALPSELFFFPADLGNIIPQNSTTNRFALLLKLSASREILAMRTRISESNGTIIGPG